MKKPEVIVIGGGVTGTVAALTLAEAGASVMLIDEGVNAGSGANAGSLHVQMQSRFMRLYPDQVPNVEAALPFYRMAAEEWVRLDKDLGGIELVRKGGLMLAETEEQLAFLSKKAEREAAQGLSVEILNREALDRIAPWLGLQIIGAELCRDEGKLNPLIANRLLGARAAAVGVRRLAGRVTALRPTPQGIELETAHETLTADKVVVAAAWGAGALVHGFGVSLPTKAEPLHMNITEPGAPVINHLVQHAERSITLKQFSTGQIVIGGGWPATTAGWSAPPTVISGSMLQNVALAAHLAPAISNLRVIRTWAGMNTTIDGASVIGPLPASDRIVMAVPGDAGYTLGPLVGRIAAQLAMGDMGEIDVGRFSPARFAT
ncbi:FAD-dependent oxidoreductase [Loktanella sp. SALINAS62]|uniref:NAD(P)/FAD-dependent oxidoreductase n=1 Tax=Loktanella sp. SALINAS62 TaxID=2706124 RepID=UPI001B8D6E3D|nr:FAD-binding oxidoreductase [Loktanella sp. SALINAS62]